MIATKLITRRAEIGDAATLARLAGELNAHFGDPRHHFTSGVAQRDLFDAEPALEALLAEVDQEAVGYAFFHSAYETSYAARGLFVSDLYVREPYRRRGVGRALVAALATKVKERHLVYLWWVSKPWNREAHAFYRAVGAIEEPVIAHALFGAPLERLAGEA